MLTGCDDAHVLDLRIVDHGRAHTEAVLQTNAPATRWIATTSGPRGVGGFLGHTGLPRRGWARCQSNCWPLTDEPRRQADLMECSGVLVSADACTEALQAEVEAYGNAAIAPIPPIGPTSMTSKHGAGLFRRLTTWWLLSRRSRYSAKVLDPNATSTPSGEAHHLGQRRTGRRRRIVGEKREAA